MMTMRVMGSSPRSGADVAGPVSPLPRPAARTALPERVWKWLPSAAMALYAAYGSNMDPAQMRRRCPASPHTGTGWLPGWRLTFGAEEYGWGGALATLVPAEHDDRRVFVAPYDLPQAHQRGLDAWGG